MSPRGDSFSLAYSLPFVKNFFRSFSRNFHAPFWAEFFDFLPSSYQTSSVCIAICLPLSRALRYTITPSSICQHLFSSFFDFFILVKKGVKTHKNRLKIKHFCASGCHLRRSTAKAIPVVRTGAIVALISPFFAIMQALWRRYTAMAYQLIVMPTAATGSRYPSVLAVW